MIYGLFTSDIWNTRRTVIFHGVFSTENLAIDIAKEKNLYTTDTNVSVIPLVMNEFEETIF